MPLIPDHLCEEGVNVKPSIGKQNKIKLDAEMLSGSNDSGFHTCDCHFSLAMLGTVVQAAGLDDTVNVANEYSRYPLENYQLLCG